MSVRGRHRPEFRSGEMTERSMNDLLRALFLRVEALERVRYVEWLFTTDGGGSAPVFSLQALSWPVKSITVARLVETSGGVSAYAAGPSLVWTYEAGLIGVSFAQALANSTSYALTLEIRG